MLYIYISEWGGFPWTGYLVPVRVCLPVDVGHAGCWLVVAVVGVIPRFFRLTFRPRFAKSRICFRIQTLKKHLGQKSTSFCREFRCASSWHSHLNRLLTFLKKKSAVGTKIDKIWLNWQYTCSNNPGRHFSEVAEAPQAATTRRRRLGITIWCQNSVKGRLWVRIVRQNRVKGIFWVSPIYLLYLMECFK